MAIEIHVSKHRLYLEDNYEHPVAGDENVDYVHFDIDEDEPLADMVKMVTFYSRHCKEGVKVEYAETLPIPKEVIPGACELFISIKGMTETDPVEVYRTIDMAKTGGIIIDPCGIEGPDPVSPEEPDEE